jgi:DNA-binding response OmpR family regulator
MSADPPRSVLYVEDDALLRKMLATILDEAGFEVVTVENGTAALQALDARRFDALITDINLGPGPAGWEVARRAREIDGTLPVVYVTGAAGADWQSNRVQGGEILVKPFLPQQIIGAVERLIVRR